MAQGKDADQLGGITKSFDQYEYVAIIIPGATLLIGLLIALPGWLPVTIDKDFSLGAFGMFLIAAYVAGQVLHAIGEVAEREFWRFWHGMPTDWVVENKPKLLDDGQWKNLPDAIKKLLGQEITLEHYKSDRKGWRALVRQIYVVVNAAGRTARIDAFNRTYGLMSGMTIALLILAAVFGIEVWCGGALISKATLGCAVALVSAGFTLGRLYASGVSYGRELFSEFLNEAAKRP